METEWLALEHGPLHARLAFPEGHTAIICSKNEMVISFRYPDMQPFGPTVRPEDNAVDIRIRLQREPTRIEKIVMADPPFRDRNSQRRSYPVGPLGRYEIYHEDRVESGLMIHSVLYVFKADDGAVVGIEEEEDAAHAYRGYRRIGRLLHLEYLFPAQLGRDFHAIDSVVAGFVSSSLEIAWDEERTISESRQP